jgi:hypothetical protein
MHTTPHHTTPHHTTPHQPNNYGVSDMYSYRFLHHCEGVGDVSRDRGCEDEATLQREMPIATTMVSRERDGSATTTLITIDIQYLDFLCQHTLQKMMGNFHTGGGVAFLFSAILVITNIIINTSYFNTKLASWASREVWSKNPVTI